MIKYKHWDLIETLPSGWKIDKSAGSPLFGYVFATNGKSILNGDKCIQRKSSEISALKAEIDALKAQNAELLAAQEGTPCKHKFHVDAGGVLFCVYCSASFSEQKEAIAKARGES